MSKIEDLIQQYCPDGVVYKPLWSLTAWDKKFNGIDKFKQQKIVKYNYLLASDLKSYQVDDGSVKLLTTNISNLYTTEELADGLESNGEVVAIPWGGNPIVQYYKGKFLTADNRIATSLDINILNNKFLYYWLLSQIKLISSFYRGSGIKHPEMAKILDLEIPVPPLPVQEEIVRILDKFTTLEAELEAELDCRKRQYEYYRDKLLNKSKSENEYKRVKLGEIGTFTRGRRFVHADDRDEGIPCIHYGELYTHYGVWADKVKTHINPELTTNFRYADKNDVIIVAAGENNVDIGIGVAWLGNEKVAVHDACFIFKHNQNPKFISYALRTYDYHQQIKSKVSQGKICSISADGLANAEIPLPPLDVQERIVNVLDNFEQLCNDLGIGLPAEIEARKKQYEYYCNKLLTFTPPITK